VNHFSLPSQLILQIHHCFDMAYNKMPF